MKQTALFLLNAFIFQNTKHLSFSFPLLCVCVCVCLLVYVCIIVVGVVSDGSAGVVSTSENVLGLPMNHRSMHFQPVFPPQLQGVSTFRCVGNTLHWEGMGENGHEETSPELPHNAKSQQRRTSGRLERGPPTCFISPPSVWYGGMGVLEPVVPRTDICSFTVMRGIGRHKENESCVIKLTIPFLNNKH